MYLPCKKRFSNTSPSQGTRQTRRRAHFHLWYMWQKFHNLSPYNADIHTTHQQQTAPMNRKRSTSQTIDAPLAVKRSKTSANLVTPPTLDNSRVSATVGSSWEVDPVFIPSNFVPSYDEDITFEDWYNFHFPMISPASFQQLSHNFADQTMVFKVNFLFGFILCNTELRALEIHHTSPNSNIVFEQPFLLSNQDNLEHPLKEISNIHFLTWVHQQRPNSKWVTLFCLNKNLHTPSY